MTKVNVGMTVSVDGFINDASGSASRLYPDLGALQGTDYMNEWVGQTGAVLMGRRTFEMGDPDSYVENYEFQGPIFVVTHRPPATAPKQDDRLTFTFVTDGIDSAVTQAKAIAGDKNVSCVGGADLIRHLLRAGLVDELHVDVMPVLLGTGRRFLDDALLGSVNLSKIGVKEIGQRTSLRFQVSQ